MPIAESLRFYITLVNCLLPLPAISARVFMITSHKTERCWLYDKCTAKFLRKKKKMMISKKDRIYYMSSILEYSRAIESDSYWKSKKKNIANFKVKSKIKI